MLLFEKGGLYHQVEGGVDDRSTSELFLSHSELIYNVSDTIRRRRNTAMDGQFHY